MRSDPADRATRSLARFLREHLHVAIDDEIVRGGKKYMSRHIVEQTNTTPGWSYIRLL